jgi:hypothetical protein
MSDLSDQDVQTFSDCLISFRDGLTEQWQQDFFDRILWLTWSVTEDEDRLTVGFNGSFTPKQASLMLDYPSGPSGPVDIIPRMIRGFIKS